MASRAYKNANGTKGDVLFARNVKKRELCIGGHDYASARFDSTFKNVINYEESKKLYKQVYVMSSPSRCYTRFQGLFTLEE